MHILRYVLCDVFTDRPLAGNAVAVFTDARRLDAARMQAVAREMNLSETVFLLPHEKGGHARIRIFTPTREVPFAGHPTLGAAFVLGQPLQFDCVVLETGSGLVTVRLEREGPRVVFGEMLQPIPTFVDYAPKAEILEALGLSAEAIPIDAYDNGMLHVLVAAPSRAAVAALRPNLQHLAELPGVCFSVFAGEGTSYKTRMFAPAAGVDEDPATGSAAGPIAVHLARQGRVPWGTQICIEQGEEIGRPSTLYARSAGSAQGVTEVAVGGSGVIVGRGELRIP